MYASCHPSVETIVLLGPTFSGADVRGGEEIGFEGWSEYMDQILMNGTDIIIYDDSWSPHQDAYFWAKNAEVRLEDAGIPSGTALIYFYSPFTTHYDDGSFKSGTNNSPRLVEDIYEWVNKVR